MGMDNKGAYAPPHETEDPFDAKLESGGRGPLLLIIAVIILAGFIAAVWGAYKKGIRKGGRNAPPVMIASSDPYKVRPKNPGGEIVPDQDKGIYDIIENPENEKEKTIKIRPSPEKPVRRKTERVDESHIGIKVKGDTSHTDKAPDIKLRGTNIREKTVIVPKTVLKKDIAQSKTQAKKVKTLTPSVAQGGYAIQIAAYRTRSTALASWRGFKRKYPSILSENPSEIIRVNLGQKGVYYRLRVVGFGTRLAAVKTCDKLKNKGQDCLIIKR